MGPQNYAGNAAALSPCSTRSPVEARAGDQSDALDALVQVVNRLEDRLVYVLGNNTKLAGAGGATPRPVPDSPIESVLEGATERVREQAARIESLIDRLRI